MESSVSTVFPWLGNFQFYDPAVDVFDVGVFVFAADFFVDLVATSLSEVGVQHVVIMTSPESPVILSSLARVIPVSIVLFLYFD